MDSLHRFDVPDPYRFHAVWGIPVQNRRGFDLLVARQLIWLPLAKPEIRAMFFNSEEQPICPACEKAVTTGDSSVICVALLADRETQGRIRDDPREIVARNPDDREAWWLLHGVCHDTLTQARVSEVNQRIELTLRADTRSN